MTMSNHGPDLSDCLTNSAPSTPRSMMISCPDTVQPLPDMLFMYLDLILELSCAQE